MTGLVWSARIAVAAGGLPDIGLYFNGGLGDDIMCSVVARELRKRGTRKIWQLTRFPALFDGNPDVTALPPDYRLRRLCGLFGVPCLELEYPELPPRHLIVLLCQAAGVQGEIALRPVITLTEAEKRAGKVTKRRQVAMQSSALGARFPMLNKQWPVERFQAVADALGRWFDIVQLGLDGDPELTGTHDLRGKIGLRETAAILSASDLFVGMAGGLMHMARAVECRSVIVYGGREDPALSGYSANENLNWTGACAPCWQRSHCDHGRACLEDIEPDMVVAAALRQAERHGMPLAVDAAIA